VAVGREANHGRLASVGWLWVAKRTTAGGPHGTREM